VVREHDDSKQSQDGSDRRKCPWCGHITIALGGVAKHTGMKVVTKSLGASARSDSYASYVQAIMSSGLTLLRSACLCGSIGLAAALKQAGLRAQLSTESLTIRSTCKPTNEASALNGVYVEDEFPANQNDTPAVTRKRKIYSPWTTPYSLLGDDWLLVGNRS